VVLILHELYKNTKVKTSVCMMFAELKRKADGTVETGPMMKASCVERKCTDLIVLGLPFKSGEDELKEYFGQFGELVLAQVCTTTDSLLFAF